MNKQFRFLIQESAESLEKAYVDRDWSLVAEVLGILKGTVDGLAMLEKTFPASKEVAHD